MSKGSESGVRAADEAIEDEILRTLVDYQTAFSGHDPQRTQLCYHKPCIAFDGKTVTALETAGEIEAFFESTFRRLEKRGWHHSEWLKVSAKRLSAGLALVSTVAVRYMNDGEELERIGGTYTFQKTDDGWKIATVISHPPETAVDFGAARTS